MYRRHRNRVAAGILLVTLTLGSIGGCPSPAQVVGYAIAYQAFSFVLEETGKFALKAAETLRKAGVVALPFQQTPTDNPATGTLSLQPGKVTALPLPGSSKSLTQQGVDGSATVAVYISDAGSANPCEDGTYVGSYELTITNGVVAIADQTLDLPAAALAETVTGVFTICIQVTSTMGVELTISEFTVTFGGTEGTPPPAQQPPSGQSPTEQPPTEQPPSGYKFATIAHAGTEELLVGQSDYIDSSVAFRLEHPFNVGGYALSGDGTKVWFWTWWHWSGAEMPTDWIRVYSMDINGGNLQRSDIPLEDASRAWAIATNDDGSEAIFELGVTLDPDSFWPRGGSRFFHCTPGGAGALVYDTVDNPPGGSGGRGLRLTDDGGKFFWADAENLWAASANSLGAPSKVATVEHLNFYGPWDPVTGGEFSYFDIDAGGDTWMINTRFWDNDTQTSRWELVSGAGELPETTQGITLAREGPLQPFFCMTDDASMVAYESEQGGYNCYVQGGGADEDLTATGPPHTGATHDVRLSDDGNIAWVVYESDGWTDGGNSTSVLYDLKTDVRRMVGTGYFYGSMSDYQLSDNGGILAAIFHCCRSSPLNHVWVLRDGLHNRSGFPSISQVAYRFDGDALIVRAKVTGENGLLQVTTHSHINGIVPNGFYSSDQSPLHGEREYFAAVEGEPNVFERTIYLQGKGNLLDGTQYLRIVAVDGKKSRVTYVDIAPVP